MKESLIGERLREGVSNLKESLRESLRETLRETLRDPLRETLNIKSLFSFKFKLGFMLQNVISFTLMVSFKLDCMTTGSFLLMIRKFLLINLKI